MTLSDRAEEILEHLWIDIVEKGLSDCDVAVLTQDAALKQLVKAEYVRVVDHRASLTTKGHDVAAGCIRRHRLAERLLTDVLDMKKPLVHDPSCGFEHLLHEGLDESICTLLGHPRTCPHGHPIPEGRCCRVSREEVSKLIVPLSDLKSQEEATVAYLQTDDQDALQKLIAMGVLPKSRLTVLQRSPTLVVKSGRSQFAIDRELASHVVVRRHG